MTKIIILLSILISCCAQAEITNKKVLILWDSSESNSLDYTTSLAHQKLEVVLNHYGIQADYLNIHNKIPDSFLKTSVIKKYRALITWINNDKSIDPIKTLKLFQAFKKENIKLALLGDIPLNNHPNMKKVKNFFKNKYLIDYTDRILENQLVLEIKSILDKNLVEFERPLTNEISIARVVKALTKNVSKLLVITDQVENTESDIIFHNQNIFYAQSNYILYSNNYNNISQWRLNPFYLTKWILNFKNDLMPDTTTLYGKRILYSHIDGDAFVSISDIDRKSYCGEIILNKIINSFKLPISTSFVAAEIDEKILGSRRLTKIIENFIENPYIEIASHTYSHPLSWNKVPTAEEIKIYSDIIKGYKSGPILAYKIPNYVELDYNKEITESLSFINKLAKKNKKTNMIFWSGSCKPPEEALKITSDNKILNMNGGDSRFDKRFPSFSHLYPLYRRVGNYYQVYSSNSNENTYTNLWEGPFGGFAEAIDTFKNTEEPYRIKPINIYYHFYSGEKESSLTALKKVYSWSLEQNVIPIFTSDYIKFINSFIGIKINKINNFKYSISNNRDLRTFKINKKVNIDYNKSEGIIGHKYKSGVTYISTLPNTECILTLTGTTKNKYPYIVESDGFINKYKFSKNKLKLEFKSYYKKKLVINNPGKTIKQNDDIIKVTYLENNIILEFNKKISKTTLEFE